MTYLIVGAFIGFGIYAVRTRKRARMCMHCGRRGCKRHDYTLPARVRDAGW